MWHVWGTGEVQTGFWWESRPVGRPCRRWWKKYYNEYARNRMGAWTGLIWLITGKVAGCCEHGNEPPGSIKCGEFLD